jgi:transcriptional regulator with XRE-family HTH domain
VLLTVKAQKPRDYSRIPSTLGEHLKKRRHELGLVQREVAAQMVVAVETLINWEKDWTKPVATQFRPVLDFLAYDPLPAPATLAERVQAKRRQLGVTFEQVARYLGWDPGSLTRYLNGKWRLTGSRANALDRFLDLDEQEAASILAIPQRRR